MESKSSKNCFVGYPVKFLILVASSLEIFIGSLLKPFFIESKELRVMLGSWKKFKISITLLSIHNIIVVIANLFRQAFNVLVCSAQRDIFVIACVFDIMKFFTTCYDNFLITVIAVAHHYQRESLTLPAMGHLPVPSQ